jgi:hypothetical protein
MHAVKWIIQRIADFVARLRWVQMGGCGSKPADEPKPAPAPAAARADEGVPPVTDAPGALPQPHPSPEPEPEAEETAAKQEEVAAAAAAAAAAQEEKEKAEAEATQEEARREEEEAEAKLEAEREARFAAGIEGRCSWCLAEGHFTARDRTDETRWVYACDVCRKNVLPCLECGDDEDEETRGMARDVGGSRGPEDLCAVCDRRLPQKSWEDVPHNVQLSKALMRDDG